MIITDRRSVGDSQGMQVWAHPHTGLQTVSWLLEGEVEHRDSVGSQAMVRPRQLHIMTAGVTASCTARCPGRTSRQLLHGVQLWVALPDADRDIEPPLRQSRRTADLRCRARGDRHRADRRAAAAYVLRRAGHTPLVGADLTVDPGAASRR